MDLNDLLAEVDGVGHEQIAAPAATRPVAPSILPERSEHAPADEMSLPLDVSLPPAGEQETLPAAHPQSERVGVKTPQFASLDLILDVELEVLVELGQARLPLKKLIAIQSGDSFLLDGRAESPLKIFVNDQLVAHGEPLVVDGSLAVRLVELLAADVEG